MSFWDDLSAEKLREDRHEVDAGNLDDSLSQRDQDLYPEPPPTRKEGE